jgi:hypothetical protein
MSRIFSVGPGRAACLSADVFAVFAMFDYDE